MYSSTRGQTTPASMRSEFLSRRLWLGLVASLIGFCCVSQALFAQDSWTTKEILVEPHHRASLGILSGRPIALSSRSVVASGLVVSAPGYEWVVTATLPATLIRKLADLGDRVEKGQVLAVLSSPALGELRRQLEELAIEQVQARANLERERNLLAEGLIPPARLQLSETRLAVLQATERARLAELASSGLTDPDVDASNLAHGWLRSPMRGQLIEANVLPGQSVEAGALLFRIADTSQLQLSLDLSLDKASQLRVGDRFRIQGSRSGGTIAGISRALHAGQQARLRGKLDRASGLALGDLVSVEIQTRQSPIESDIQIVPASALSQYKDKSVIFIETTKGFRAQSVDVLTRLDGQIHIRSKLGEHERFAIAGVAALRALLQKAD